jgi:signal transduction histidine kinase
VENGALKTVMNLLSRSIKNRPDNGRNQFEAVKVETLYRQMPLVIAGSSFGALVIVILLWQKIPIPSLIGWLCLIGGVAGLRFQHYLNFFQTDEKKRRDGAVILRNALQAAFWGSVANGLLWSAALVIFMPTLGLPERMMLIFIVGGFSAAAVGSTSIHPPSFYAWILTAQLTSTLVTFSIATDETGLSMAIMLIFFTIIMTIFGANTGHTLGLSIRNNMAQMALKSELSLMEERVRSALENVPSAVLLFDAQDQLIVWNRRTLEIFPELAPYLRSGISFSVLTERSAALLTPPNPLSAFQQGDDDIGIFHERDYLAERMAVHRAPKDSWDVALSDGRFVQGMEARLPDGGYLTTYIDITALKRQESRLTVAKDDAERANMAKSRFIALMSHELRTPLNAILGFAQSIARADFGPLETQYQEYGQVIHDSGDHLMHVINDILDLSKIEAGRMAINPERIDAGRTIQSAMRVLQDRAQTANLTIATDVGRHIPTIFADPRVVHQMLLNLIANAIKFTPSGGQIVVGACLVAEEVCLFVRDTGIGIESHDLHAVLQPFGQVDDGLNRQSEGTGLGVPLTKSLIELHGGRLEIDSEPGRGSEFRLIFPPECMVETRPNDHHAA